MRLAFFVYLVLTTTTSGVEATTSGNKKSFELFDRINSQKGWVAHSNPVDPLRLKQLMGAQHGFKSKYLVSVSKSEEVADDELPEQFDSREHWPKCASVIGNIADQSECGSCYAVASSSAMSDRLCISSGGQTRFGVSAADILSCCRSCGFGCNGGSPDLVFDEWADNGFVSGSGHLQGQGCRPYPFPSCQHEGLHYSNSSLPKCLSKYYDTPECVQKCQQAYKFEYDDDKTYGQKQVVWLRDVESIQREIMKNGPVVSICAIFEDFTRYVSGIYEKLSDNLIGYHAVRLIGWGNDNGTDFWMVANSWSEDWGENGYFRIKRGVNEAEIESQVFASLPDITRSAKLLVVY